MTRFKLNLHGCDFPLGEGELVIGRDAAICHLVIDDPRVSRRHATIRVRAHGLTIADLESRNGVLVNGVPITQPVALDDHDVLTIGGHELSVGIVRTATRPLRASGTRDASRTADPISDAIDEALEAGRTEEAARLASERLQAVLVGVTTGSSDARALGAPTRYAVRLAAATRDAMWVDWVFEAHHVAGAVIPVAVIDQMFVIARVSRYSASQSATEYLDGLNRRVASLSSMERIAHIRVQGLLRSLHSHSSGPQETCPDPISRPQKPQSINRSK